VSVNAESNAGMRVEKREFNLHESSVNPHAVMYDGPFHYNIVNFDCYREMCGVMVSVCVAVIMSLLLS
jgi:hypothetical protein